MVLFALFSSIEQLKIQVHALIKSELEKWIISTVYLINFYSFVLFALFYSIEQLKIQVHATIKPEIQKLFISSCTYKKLHFVLCFILELQNFEGKIFGHMV